MKWESYSTTYINKDSYPVKPTSTATEIAILLPHRYRCFNELNDITYRFKYLENSVPILEKEGYVIRFHDPYDIVTKDAPTFNTMTDQTISLGIIPKVTRIDESLVTEKLEL